MSKREVDVALHIALVIVRIAIVLVGATLAYSSYKASRNNEENRGPLLALSLAFTLITIGAIIEGLLFEFFKFSLTQVHIVESLVTAAGLAIVLYAMITTKAE